MPMIASRLRAAPLGALVLLAACAAPAGAPSASATGPATSRAPFETVTPSPSDDVADAPEGLPEAAWTAIVDDLAERLGEPVVDPTVISVVAKTWNDGSLGCPQPGQVYTQALVDGFQVVLEVDGEEFDYRIGGGTDVRLCEG
jgi:hypothetical protein